MKNISSKTTKKPQNTRSSCRTNSCRNRTRSHASAHASSVSKRFFWAILVFCTAIIATVSIFSFRKDLDRAKNDKILAERREKERAALLSSEKPDSENAEEQSQKSESKPQNPEEKKPVQYEPAGPKPKSIVGFINHKDFIDNQLVINTVVRQLLPEDGKCTLTLTPPKNQATFQKQISSKSPTPAPTPITLTVDTGNDPTTSYCQSFKIPREKLSSGKWHIKIDIHSGNLTGIIEDEVDL